MQRTSSQSSQANYTILRIKRKRNEEPLDALVIESSRRKKTKGNLGDDVSVFQFAETVEQDAFEDEKQKHDLESRISRIARENARKEPQPSESQPPPKATRPPSPAQTRSPRVPLAEKQPAEKRSPRVPARFDDPSKKYTIVPPQDPGLRSSESDKWERAKRGRLMAPPKVHSYKELQKATFTMYDAIPSSSSLAGLASPNPSAQAGERMDVDPEVAKFLPMLQDYLKISGEASPSVTPSGSRAGGLTGEDDDYVWDVFYSRPASYRELYGDQRKAIGTVTGLPEDDTYGSSDESDGDDEDDEDSNAEDWYKNDYPDEESDRSDPDDASDGFHEHSDYDDVVHARGQWDLGTEDDSYKTL